MIEKFTASIEKDFKQDYNEITLLNVIKYMSENGYGCYECMRNKVIIQAFWKLKDAGMGILKACKALGGEHNISTNQVYFVVFPEKRHGNL